MVRRMGYDPYSSRARGFFGVVGYVLASVVRTKGSMVHGRENVRAVAFLCTPARVAGRL